MSEEYGSDFVVLVDEDGVEQEFEILDTLETDDARYVAFLPVPAEGEEEDEEAEIVILRVEPGEDGEDLLASIEDEAELERAYELFMRHIEEEEAAEEN